MRMEFMMAGSFCIVSTTLIAVGYLTMESHSKGHALQEAERAMNGAKRYDLGPGVPTCGSGALHEMSSTGKPDGEDFAMHVIATRDGCDRPVVVTYRRHSSRYGWSVDDLDVTKN